MCEYKKFIISNLTSLVEDTELTEFVINECLRNRIINKEEAEKLRNPMFTSSQKKSMFWDTIQKRSKCMTIFIGTFKANSQNTIAELLEKSTRDDGSDQKYNFIKNLKPLSVEVARPKETTVHADDGYLLDPDIIGAALILNITRFHDTRHNRLGAANDSKYMKELWSQLGYKTQCHEGSLTSDQLGEKTKKLLTQFKKNPALQTCVVFVGTHGESGTLFMSDGEDVDILEFMAKFTDSVELKNKPKIFIFQGCQSLPTDAKKTSIISSSKDTIVCFPTVPGSEAIRDIKLGSWFIYTLTDVFMREAHRWEIRQLLKEVRKTMLTKIECDDDIDQVSFWIDFNQLQPLYFNVAPEDN